MLASGIAHAHDTASLRPQHRQAATGQRVPCSHHRERQPSKRQRLLCKASSTEKAHEELGEEQLEKWNACVGQVEHLGFDTDKAGEIVGQAFGWGKQSYWLKKKKNEVPNEDQVDSVLKYLQDDLGLKGEDLTKVVKDFPEVLNLKVEGRLKANIEHMQKAYYMKQPQAVNTVKRMPSVLGFTYDCEGSCEGMCNQCWVRL